jgi:hypothetical protein
MNHWVRELSSDMFPAMDAWAFTTAKEDAVTAFTEQGIEWLKQMIADARAAGPTPIRDRSTE